MTQRQLTEKQQAILACIQQSVRQRGYPPSMREIGSAVGLTSTSSVAHQLKVLEEKGFLKRDPHRPRALEVFLPELLERRTSLGHSLNKTADNFDEAGYDVFPDAVNVPVVGTIAAGTILAAGLYFGAGLLV